MDVATPNHWECARVYVFIHQENVNLFVINCLFCNEKYSDWLKFCNHLQDEHLYEIKFLQQKKYGIKNEEFDLNSEYLEEEYQLDNGTDDHFEECETKSEYLDEEETSRDSNRTICIRKEPCFDYTNDDPFLEEYITVESLEDHEEGNVESEKSPEPVSTCFFRLHTTDAKIMLKFIELLRQHPCQWDNKHNNFTHKDKRWDSTVCLTKQLNKCFNLNITPQGTRASVLALIRWFDNEYIRLLNCQQKVLAFVCTHREYFKNLLEFLPYQHLKPMTCDECSKRFKSEHLLMAHKHKHHNGQVPFRCRYCGHGFIHQSSHKMHENRHIKIHVWPCNICLYQAASKSDYIKHLATHSSKQPYKCNICGLTYKTKTNLNVHMKSHSLPEYECEICKKKFYEKYRYKRHIWQHEEQEMSGKSIDNFTCEICGRRFTSNKTLMKHQLVHIQEDYKVDGQPDGYNKLVNVVVHFCDYCALEFVHKEAFETHMNLKHNTKIN